MVSAVDQAKRALVALLRTLAAAYACAVRVTRDSADAEIRTAYRAVSRKVHPDRPTGCAADQKRLNVAHEKWQALLKAAPGLAGLERQAPAVGQDGVRGPSPCRAALQEGAEHGGALRGRPAQRLQGGPAEEGCCVQGLSRGARACATRAACIFGSRRSFACHQKKRPMLAAR